MKILKQIIITLIAIAISMTGVYGGYTLFASDSKYDGFLKKTSFYPAQNSYHAQMNKFFDDKFSKLVTMVKKNPNFLSDKNFNPPEDSNETNYREKCGTDNISTYCVAMEAMDLYLIYIKHIEDMYSSVENARSIQLALEMTSQRNMDIQAEAMNARLVMEATVKAYDEFRLAYPVHIKFRSIITDLTKYKLLLRDIRGHVALFPEEFVDSTSKDCE